MNYSFMSFSTPELSLEEMLAQARQFGYQGIEPRIDAKHAHGVETSSDATARTAARDAAAKAGIALACIATSCVYADPAETDKQIENTHAAIDLAGDVGSHRLRVFGGLLPEGMQREDAIERVSGAMKKVADHAAERGVVVCMETHDHWCDPDHLAEVMRRVDHPAIAVNWDIMHPIRVAGSTMDAAWEALRPWVRHVHFHDGTDGQSKLKMLPIGEGVIDHRRAVELLQAAGYEDYLSGEWNWPEDPWQDHLPRELATMKRYEAETAK